MKKPLLQPLDRAALVLMLVLGLMISLMLWMGDQTYPRVRSFNWQDQQVGIDDRAFILTFNRAMDWSTVASNLQVSPPLAGKLSWSGRRLAYTLTESLPYGQTFQVRLTGAVAANAQAHQRPMQPFTGEFQSRDRKLVYLGITGNENGRLVLKNLTQKTQAVLTPPDLNVLEFLVNPGQNRVVFTAIPRNQPDITRYDAQLYAVPLTAQVTPTRPQLLLDNNSHQILDFDLNPYDDQLIVQRFGLGETGQIHLWTLDPQNQLQKIAYKTDGSTFQLAPDNQTLAVSLNQGVALLRLTAAEVQTKPEFLPQVHIPLSFAPDGSAALMVRKNADQTRTLVWLPNNGPQQDLLSTSGYIFDAQVDVQQQTVYGLYSQFNPDLDFRTDLHLQSIDLKTKQQQVLATFPNQLSGHFSLAPDASELIYEEITVTDQAHPSAVRNVLGQTIVNSTLWRLPLKRAGTPESKRLIAPQKLGTGLKAQWVP